MILEKIIFNLLAFAIFTVVFFRMVRKNDTNYLYLLLFEFFGILLNFIELIAKVEFNVFLKMIIYLFSIIIPLLILIVEWKKNLMFSEILEVSICKLLLLLNKQVRKIYCPATEKQDHSSFTFVVPGHSFSSKQCKMVLVRKLASL